MCLIDLSNLGGAPNYYPNSFHGAEDGENCKDTKASPNTFHAALSTFSASGDVKKYNTRDEDNYSQVC